MHILVTVPVTQADKETFASIAPSCTFEYTSPKSLNEEIVAKADIAIGNIPLPLLPFATNLKWQQLNICLSKVTPQLCRSTLPFAETLKALRIRQNF